jgi:hypothetical protein
MNHIVGDINRVIDQQGELLDKFKAEIRRYTIGRIMAETQGAWGTVLLDDKESTDNDAHETEGKLLKHYIKK